MGLRRRVRLLQLVLRWFVRQLFLRLLAMLTMRMMWRRVQPPTLAQSA